MNDSLLLHFIWKGRPSPGFSGWPVMVNSLHDQCSSRHSKLGSRPHNMRTLPGLCLNLHRKGSVAQYLFEFEDLANRTIDLPPHFLLSCFVSGLTPDIIWEVQALQPLTLVQAADLAKLQEEKFLDARISPWPRPSLPPLVPPLRAPSPSVPLLPSPPRSPTPSFKRLSSEEITSRRERDLCFSCDEKYHRGHRCASRVFLFVADEDEAPIPNIASFDPGLDLLEPVDLPQAQISFNSLVGHLAPETLRLLGSLFGHQVVVLVDGGSTHNFIQNTFTAHVGVKHFLSRYRTLPSV